ncbi:MAG TPA: class I adenylate-forming enzyme family protein [Pseudorhizobium sp.]|nr:class I adenylate-forming enzyme family protein [Pseudorhizobium sp.]
MRIETRFRDSVRRFAGKTAVAAGESRLSYAELDARSDGLAAALANLGVSPDERVVFLLDNDVEAPVSFLATWKAGAIACPLYPSMKAEKLAAIFSSIEPAAIITQARHLANVRSAIAAAGSKAVIIAAQAPLTPDPDLLLFEELVGTEPTGPLANSLHDTSLALLIHTSGSTGKPKGVMLTHANVDAACQSIIDYLGNTSDDIVLNVLPLSFGYGITQLVTMACVGGTLVLEKSFAFPRKILDRLAEEKVTGFPLVPAMAALICGMKDLPDALLPRLRYLTSAAAALPPALSSRLQQILPQTKIFVMYGQTECLRVSFLPPEELAARPTSVGKAIPGTQAFVVDERGRPAAHGTVGELVVEGPHVMSGYWRDKHGALLQPEATGSPRRLLTGDLFRADEEGFLYFVSRKDDIIKTRGEKVSPQEVERVLYALPGIREAAVTGTDDPIFGQVVSAYVALEPGRMLSERDILRHCASQLEDYMVPKTVEFRDALPRTTTGKIRMSAGADTVEPQLEKAT